MELTTSHTVKSAREVIAEIERDSAEGQNAVAMARLGLLLDMKLEDTADYEARGRHLLHYCMYEEAIRDLEVAVSRNTDNPQTYFDLGNLLAALGRREEALDMLRGAVRLMPESADASYALSWELERLGRYDEALDVLRRRPKSNHDRRIYQHWGRIRGKQKKWKSAFTNYTRAVWMRKPNPDRQDPVTEQKYRSIMKIRRIAAGLDPEDPKSFSELSALLCEVEWFEIAADVASTGVLMRPHAGAYMVMGEVWESKIRMPEAIDAYKEAIERLSGIDSRSNIASLYEALVGALYKCGRRREVMQYGAEAISLKVASRKMRKHYNLVKEEPDLPDQDQVRGGLTASHYVDVLLKPAD